MLTEQLKTIGLSDYEARILAALFAQSPLGASTIAKQLGLSRSSVYASVSTLIAKGLVATTFTNNVKQFVPTGHEAVEQLLQVERVVLDQKTKAMEHITLHLTAMRKDGLHVPHVGLFEGVEGLKRIYLSMLRDARQHDMMLVLRDEFIWDAVWSFSWEEEWQERVRRWKVEKDIQTELLINPTPTERARAAFYDARQGLAFRYLPAAQAVDRFALYVVGDTVALMSFETGNLIGLKLVNAHFAKNMTILFHGLWSLAES